MVGFEPEPQTRRGRADDLVLPGHREADADLGIDVSRGQLVGGLVAVPAVGDEHQVVGQHQQHVPRTR